jgi:hypothetical protein
MYAVCHFFWYGLIAAKKYLAEFFFNLKRITVDAWNS